jgi:hypothetical protein
MLEIEAEETYKEAIEITSRFSYFFKSVTVFADPTTPQL